MTIAELATTLAAFTAVLTFIGAVISRALKNHTSKVVSDLIKEYLSELKPNHGSSLRDEITYIRDDVIDLKVDLAKLEGKFDQHIKETID
jgi:hypothetical protein